AHRRPPLSHRWRGPGRDGGGVAVGSGDPRLGNITFGPARVTAGGCFICGDETDPGALHGPRLSAGTPGETPTYAPSPRWPGAEPLDIAAKRDRIIDLLEALQPPFAKYRGPR